jgi:hypothetical protein
VDGSHVVHLARMPKTTPIAAEDNAVAVFEPKRRDM